MDFNEGADSFLEWAPVMMTSCLGNPSHAPCLKLKKKPAFAHELLYPPFKLDPPKFIANITANSDRYMAVIWAKALKTDKTVTAIQERAWTDDGGSAYYLNLNGKVSALPRFFASMQMQKRTQNVLSLAPLQVFGYENVALARPVSGGGWAECQLSGKYQNRVESLVRNLTGADKVTAETPAVLWAVTPQSDSWQHFLDRGTNVCLCACEARDCMFVCGHMRTKSCSYSSMWVQVWAQSEHALRNFQNDKIVVAGWSKFWQHLNLDRAATANQATRLFVTSCHTPLIHPYLLQKARFKMLTSAANLLGAKGVPPLRDRKVVVFADRGDKTNRRILNLSALKDAVSALLVRRARGETFRVLDRLGSFAEFGSLVKLQHFLLSEVAVFMGPHGGQFYNHRWCAKGTLVIEFLPLNRLSTMFWETVVSIGHIYATQLLPDSGTPKNHDMNVAISPLVEFLDRNMGIAVHGLSQLHHHENMPFIEADS